MKRTISFSLRIPLELVEKLENAVKIKKFPSVAEAIRSYVLVGMHVESYKRMIKDPEFLKSIERLKQNEGIFQWIETLTAEQADAIKMAIEMDKEKRYENQTRYGKFS